MFVGWWKQKMAIQERMRRRSCASSYWKFVECLRRREAARNCMCVFYDRGCLRKEYLGKGLLTVPTHSHLVTFNFSTSTFHSQNMMKLHFWMILTFKMILLQHAYLSTLQPCSWWAKVAQRWNYARHKESATKVFAWLWQHCSNHSSCWYPYAAKPCWRPSLTARITFEMGIIVVI